MSDFVRQPLERKLNNQNIMTRIKRLERASITPTPTQPVENVSELAQGNADVIYNGREFYSLNSNGEQVSLSNYDYIPHNYMLPASSELWGTGNGALPYTAESLGSGSVSEQTGNENHPGILRLSSVASSNTGGRIYLGGVSTLQLRGGEVFECIFSPLSFATQSNVKVGFFDTLTSSADVDGVYFGFVGNGVSAVTLSADVYSNSVWTPTTVVGSVLTSIIASVWYYARIEIDANAATGNMWLYNVDADTLIGQWYIPSGIPTGSGRELTCGVKAYRTNAVATALADVDRVDLYNTIALGR